jgi:hypothetical protein
MAFSIPVTMTNRMDAFIDDLVNIALDTPSDLERGGHAVKLTIHVTSRPHAGELEPIPRRNLVQDKKLETEGAHAEVQIVLGWALNYSVLTIALPLDKFLAWERGLISLILAEGRSTMGDLESLVGRLNHAALIIPLSRHFLNRI